MKKIVILAISMMLTLASASTCFAGIENNSENIVSERIPITFEGAYSNSGMAKMSVSAKASSDDMDEYFFGKSETKVEYDSVGQYNLHYKRAIATSKGYVGKHYLKAWVSGYESSTLKKKWDTVGFTLKSGWAVQPSIPVIGVAKCGYGF